MVLTGFAHCIILGICFCGLLLGLRNSWRDADDSILVIETPVETEE